MRRDVEPNTTKPLPWTWIFCSLCVMAGRKPWAKLMHRKKCSFVDVTDVVGASVAKAVIHERACGQQQPCCSSRSSAHQSG